MSIKIYASIKNYVIKIASQLMPIITMLSEHNTSSDAHETIIPRVTSKLTNDSNFVSDASYVHTDNNFTTALKTKLENAARTTLENKHYIGMTGEPSYQNNWAGVTNCAFLKDNFGFVHLEGTIKSGTVGTTIFTLPMGYRPSESKNFPVISNSEIGWLSVSSCGIVALQSGSNIWLSLDGIIFNAN